MNNLETSLLNWSPRFLSVLRIITGFIFVPHGMQKLFGLPAPAAKGTVEVFSLMGLAGTIEIVGGLLLLFGLFTRPAAFVLSGFSAAAYFMVHAPQGFWPLLNRGDLAVILCFLCLYLAAAGPGPWSLDHLMRRDASRP